MMFSIITPSFRGANWLPLCIASVADQESVDLEHIIQDSCSDDGSAELLARDSRVQSFIEKDQGMYDAVNRGFRRARGDILAYLNCDEQYLPGALAAVEEFFRRNPDTDVCLSDTIVTDSSGAYICSRYSLVPGRYQMWIRFPVLTSSLFIRRRVVKDLGIYCNTAWRDLGDWVWIRDMVLKGVHFGVLPRFTSVFTDTGENMNMKENALREHRKNWEMTPRWIKLLRHAFLLKYRLQLLMRGANTQQAFEYAIYTHESASRRKAFCVEAPTSFWKGRRGKLR